MRRGDERVEGGTRPHLQGDLEHRAGPGVLCLECGARTTERKPYCGSHLHLMPYFAAVTALARDHAVELACADALVVLRFRGGACTLQKLSQETGVDPETFKRALWSLTRTRRIETWECVGRKGHRVAWVGLVSTGP